MPASNVADPELREQLGRGAKIIDGAQILADRILADRRDSPVYLPGDPRLEARPSG